MNPRQSRHGERGNALIESAITIPILLLLMVGIFEVGRAYETWQVITNAAREGARMSVTPSGTDTDTTTALVRQYMQDGQLGNYSSAAVDVNRNATIMVNGTVVGASLVTVDYPFEFIMLQPVARLVVPGTNTGEAITMRATALMRNEAQ
jgi:Flp pilus assembly protein TadG